MEQQVLKVLKVKQDILEHKGHKEQKDLKVSQVEQDILELKVL